MLFEKLFNLAVTKYIIHQCLGMPIKEKTSSVLLVSSVEERILILLILMREANEIFPFLTALILHVLVYMGSVNITGKTILSHHECWK